MHSSFYMICNVYYRPYNVYVVQCVVSDLLYNIQYIPPTVYHGMYIIKDYTYHIMYATCTYCVFI